MALDMKHLFTLVLLAPLALWAQYSDFYGKGTGTAEPSDSGEVRLTYATAKFGDLGRQNMKEEMNRINQEIESGVYKDKKDKDKAIAAAKMDLMVAKNPIKAHQYGKEKLLKYSIKHKGYGGMMLQGFLAYVEKAILPHPSLFEFEEEKHIGEYGLQWRGHRDRLQLAILQLSALFRARPHRGGGIQCAHRRAQRDLCQQRETPAKRISNQRRSTKEPNCAMRSSATASTTLEPI